MSTYEERLNYCKQDAEVCHVLSRLLNVLPSFTWLCEHLDQWYVEDGRIIVKPQYK